MTDSELLRRYAREGKQEAFQEFVRRHVDLVYGAARRRLGGSVHRAQDVTQTVFTDAAKKADRLASHPAMTGWLYTSAYRAAAALMRAEERRARREREAATMNQIDAISGGKVAGLDTTLLAAIEHAVMELPERDREAVLMRFLEQRRFAEIGAALRVSEDAARVRVDRALVRLRSRLAQIGITSSAAALAATLEAAPGVAPAPVGLIATVARQAAANATVSVPLAGTLAWGLGMAALAVTTTGSYRTWREHQRLESVLAAPAITQPESSGRRPGLAGRAALSPVAARSRSAAGGSTSGGAARAYADGLKWLASNPALLAAYQAHVRAAPLQKYGALLASWSLPTADEQRFLQLNEAAGNVTVVPQGQVKDQVLGQLYLFGPETSVPSPGSQSGIEYLQPDEAAAQLQALLGPKRYQEYLDFDATVAQRDVASSFAGAALLANEPVTVEQYRAALNGAVDQNELSPVQSALLSAARLREESVAIEAASHVMPPNSPPQWEALK